LDNKENILVHCHMGISRSSAIVASYLIRQYTLTVEDAIEQIRMKRFRCRPNDGFLADLKCLETLRFGVLQTHLKKYLPSYMPAIEMNIICLFLLPPHLPIRNPARSKYTKRTYWLNGAWKFDQVRPSFSPTVSPPSQN
jgi:hypothetical protein